MNSLQRLYEKLALHFDRQQQPRQRDIFLVLAADAALAAGSVDEAEGLRVRLLQLTPHSLLRPYASWAEALQSRDIQDYVADLRRQFPPEQAELLLHGGNGKHAAPPAEPATPSAAPIHHVPDEAPARPMLPPLPGPRTSRPETPSPYERFEPPPPGPGFEAWGNFLALLLFGVVLLAALGLGAYVVVRPWVP